MFEEASFDDDDINCPTVNTSAVAADSSSSWSCSPSRLPPTVPATPIRSEELRKSMSKLSTSTDLTRRIEPNPSSSSSAAAVGSLNLLSSFKSRRGNGAHARYGYLAADDNSRLHKAGDSGYRLVCAPPSQQATSSSNNKSKKQQQQQGGGNVGRYDDNFVSGDAWGSSVCHCMVCEMHVAFDVVKNSESIPISLSGTQSDRLLRSMLGLPPPPRTAKNERSAAADLPASAPSMVSGPVSADVPPTVVLWDMDNFGFNHMKIEASRLAKHTIYCGVGGNGNDNADEGTEPQKKGNPKSGSEESKLGSKQQRTAVKRSQRPEDGGHEKVLNFAQNTIFWFFYGSCFARRHETTPLDYVKSLRSADASSLWGVLSEHSQLLFTPCGGHSQAADEVMTAIALGLFPTTSTSEANESSPLQIPPFPVIIVTRDKGLNQTVKQLAGAESTSCSSVVKAVRCVDPQATGGTFVPFWADLTKQVEEARREFALVTALNEGK